MYLSINPITSYGKQGIKKFAYKQNPNNEGVSKETNFIQNNINFGANLKLRKPAFADAELQKAINKISSLLKKLPEFSETKKPIQIPFKEGVLGFTINKSVNERSKISIKIKEKSDKIKDWDSITEFDKGMEFVLNKKGQMIEGVYYEAGGCHLLFRRQQKNYRRILYKHNEYMPENFEKYSWKRISGCEKIFSTCERIYVDPKKAEAMFFEMAELDTSLLAK